jgi:hypothetical protein
MQKIHLDGNQRITLNDPQKDMEICNQAGQTGGYFLPAESYRRIVYEWAKTRVTVEELEEARKQEPGGRLLKDILADLEKKECGLS